MRNLCLLKYLERAGEQAQPQSEHDHRRYCMEEKNQTLSRTGELCDVGNGEPNKSLKSLAPLVDGHTSTYDLPGRSLLLPVLRLRAPQARKLPMRRSSRDSVPWRRRSRNLTLYESKFSADGLIIDRFSDRVTECERLTGTWRSLTNTGRRAAG